MDNSLRQYLDLHDAHTALLDRGTPAPLQRARAEARRALEGQRLPRRGDEGYAYTSIDAMLAPDMGVNLSRLDFPADVASTFRCDIPNMSTLLGVVAGDVWHPTASLLRNLPEGVVFGSFRSVAASHPELLERYYGSTAPLDDPATALNTLLCQDGVMIYLPRGVRLERPLQLVNILRADRPQLAVRRLLVVADEGAQGSVLLCDHTQGSEAPVVALQVVEVVAGRGASLDIYDIEKSNAATSRHSLAWVRAHGEANVLLNTTTLACGTTRNDVTAWLEGPRAELRLTGMAIADASQSIDNATCVVHRAERCRSNQLYKYTLDGDASGAFEGSIEVTPEAPYSEAYQTNRNIVASPTARMHAKPQLLIYNDEVRCSHGAATGQLDADALFYMRTRGIPEPEARRMLMQAFMADVIDSVRFEALRDRLRHLVEMRYGSGAAPACDTCHPSSSSSPS